MRSAEFAGRTAGATKQGSILVEVMVAIAMLAVFLAGIFGAFRTSLEAAVGFREKAAQLPTSLLAEEVARAWTWGPVVDSVEWRAGPVATVTPGLGCYGEEVVGVWADGWFVGEWCIDGSEPRTLDTLVWSDFIGAEVVVRARGSEGGWGAPWRTMVPDAYGNVAGKAPVIAVDPVSATGFLDAQAMMHPRSMGMSGIVASWVTTPISYLLDGLVATLGSGGAGVCVVEADERSQSWLGHVGRHLDVYW